MAPMASDAERLHREEFLGEITGEMRRSFKDRTGYLRLRARLAGTKA
jgi:hypothetical protein